MTKVKIPKWFAEEIEIYKSSRIFDLEDLITYLSPCRYHDTYQRYRKNNFKFSESQFQYIHDNFTKCIRAILDDYEIEERRYYAKVKGSNLVCNDSIYWSYKQGSKRFTLLDNTSSSAFKKIFTMPEWNKLGINKSNADFEEVEE